MTQLQSPSQRVLRLVRELNFQPHSYFIGGSGALALRDFRHVSDLDVGVTTRYWFELLDADKRWDIIIPDPYSDIERCDPPYLSRVVLETQVHIFYHWRRRDSDETVYNDYNLVFKDGLDWIHGVPAIKLNILLRQKMEHINDGNPRLKDIEDIQMIAAYMHSVQP